MTSEGHSWTAKPKRVLMVVANPGVSGMTGLPIGFWVAELIDPWYEFRQAGYEVVVASPDGGQVRMDALSDPRDQSGYSASDGNLITGQHQYSGRKVAELVIEALAEETRDP